MSPARAPLNPGAVAAASIEHIQVCVCVCVCFMFTFPLSVCVCEHLYPCTHSLIAVVQARIRHSHEQLTQLTLALHPAAHAQTLAATPLPPALLADAVLSPAQQAKSMLDHCALSWNEVHLSPAFHTALSERLERERLALEAETARVFNQLFPAPSSASRKPPGASTAVVLDRDAREALAQQLTAIHKQSAEAMHSKLLLDLLPVRFAPPNSK
jgi:hypothetical protein